MSRRHDENRAVRYEKEDINEPSTFWFGAVILIVMVVVALLTKPLYDLLAERETVAQPAAAYVAESDPDALEPPGPRLQVNPETDLATFRAQEEGTLTTYAWVDKEHGIVRIPVQEAMRIVAERGLPAFPAEETEDPEEEDPS
jgi:hypothetical protein